MKSRYSIPRLVVTAAGAVSLTAVFAVNSIINSQHEDYRNSNFAKFWVAGHMIIAGENPYNPVQWKASQTQLGSTWTPDKIFLYPLPQAFLLAPLALFPPAESFILWGILSQGIIAAICFWLLRRDASSEQGRLFVPLVLFLLFFGPVYLGLQIGAIGVIALATLAGSIVLIDRNQSFLGGMLLSALMLKPPQGLPILLLLAFWQVLRRDAKALFGMIAGGMLLLVVGLLYDPLWIGKFLANSQIVSSRTLGTQSNLWSYSFLVCGQNSACTLITGIFAVVLLLSLTALLISRYRVRLGALEALNLIVPIAYLCAPYLFAYDQVLFVIPITWACSRLVRDTKSYIPTFTYLIVLDVLTMALLVVQASTQKDLWSSLTALLVFGMCLALLELDRKRSLTGRLTA